MKSRIVLCQIFSCLCQHSQLCPFPLVQTMIEFTNWIPKRVRGPVFFNYDYRLIIFLVVCCKELQGLKVDWNLGQQQDAGYSNQISTRLIPIRSWKCRRMWLWSSLWKDMHDHVRKISTRSMTGASGSKRLVSYWCLYDLYFQLLINCISGRVHVNLYLDFSRAYPQKWLTWWRKKKSGYNTLTKLFYTVHSSKAPPSSWYSGWVDSSLQDQSF